MPNLRRNSLFSIRFAALLWLLTVCAEAQPVLPHIGYVYPAGGQVGSTFEVTVGGQSLEGTTNAFVSGTGVEAVVVDFHRPMQQGEFNKLRDRLKELQDKRRASAEDGPKNATNSWSNADEKEVAEIRAKILRNPPNRNAAPAIADTVTLKVTIATNAVPGEREIRVANTNTCSNPLLFLVGQSREFSKAPARTPNPELDRFLEKLGHKIEQTTNRSEMRIQLPAVANGQIMPGAVDRFRFFAQKGQKLVVEVSARRLIPYLADAVPGWFQATLALYDAKGHELQYADDYRFNPDPVLFYEIPWDGDYIVEIKDSIYRGREDFVYRISVGEFPFITSMFPLGGKAGTQTEVELKGWNLDQNRLKVEAAQPGNQSIFVKRDEWISNRMPFAVNTDPEIREDEPNNAPRKAQKIRLPVMVNGRIDQPGDVDVFRFEGHAGEQIVAEVFARRLNSPIDSVLKLTDSSGEQIAFNDDHEDKGSGLTTHHADSYLMAKLPTNGTYYLQISDAQHQGGQEFGYRLRISAPEPDFELRIVPSTINLRGGASALLTLYALRKDGFTNEIDLALKGASAGFALSGAWVPPNQDKVLFTVTAPGDVPAAPVSLAIEGTATIDGRTVSHFAVPAEDMMQAFAYRHLVPSKDLLAMVSARFAQKTALKIVSDIPATIPVGGTTTVRLNAPGRGLAERLHLQLSEPPDGITLEKVVPSKAGAELVFRSDAKVKPGLGGNLVVEVFASKPDAAPGKQANQRRQPIAVLPAIPFTTVASH